MEVFVWYVGGESEPLILRTFLHIFFGIIEHLGPITPLVDDFMGKRSATDMVPTIFFVDLLHYPLGFVRFEAPQVWIGVQLGV